MKLQNSVGNSIYVQMTQEIHYVKFKLQIKIPGVEDMK